MTSRTSLGPSSSSPSCPPSSALQGDDIVPIPGTNRRKWLELNAAAVDLSLSDAELHSLRGSFPPGAAGGLRYPEFQLRKLGI